MNKELFGITFQAWQWWIALVPMLLVSLVAYAKFRKKEYALSICAYSPALIINYARWRGVVKLILLTLGLIFLWVALLRPSWGTIDQQIEQEGRDLLVVLDVSRSMLAQDLTPNRLEFAKKKIEHLVKKLDCDRVGLMLFSGSPIIQCPLTRDYAAFFLFLKEIDAEVISSGTTALDAALLKALEMFEKLGGRKHKIVVIFTDGEDFSSNLAEIKSKAIKQGMTIFTVGVGTSEGSPIPLYDVRGNSLGHQRDEKGNIVISRLNEGILTALSRESGGSYTSIAVQCDSDIGMILNRVQEFEREKFQESKLSRLVERYPLAVVASLLCFLLEWIL